MAAPGRAQNHVRADRPLLAGCEAGHCRDDQQTGGHPQKRAKGDPEHLEQNGLLKMLIELIRF